MFPSLLPFFTFEIMVFLLNGDIKKTRKSNNCFCKTHFQDILLMITIAIIVISLAALYCFMGTDGRWAVDPIRRKTVLGIAVVLFFSVSALCWFILRKDQMMKWAEERRKLIVDRPPCYDSCLIQTTVINQPPPSYIIATNK